MNPFTFKIINKTTAMAMMAVAIAVVIGCPEIRLDPNKWRPHDPVDPFPKTEPKKEAYIPPQQQPLRNGNTSSQLAAVTAPSGGLGDLM